MLPKGGILIVIGNLNAKADSNNTLLEHVMGSHCLNDDNDNDNMWISAASTRPSLMVHC